MAPVTLCADFAFFRVPWLEQGCEHCKKLRADWLQREVKRRMELRQESAAEKEVPPANRVLPGIENGDRIVLETVLFLNNKEAERINSRQFECVRVEAREKTVWQGSHWCTNFPRSQTQT